MCFSESRKNIRYESHISKISQIWAILTCRLNLTLHCLFSRGSAAGGCSTSSTCSSSSTCCFRHDPEQVELCRWLIDDVHSNESWSWGSSCMRRPREWTLFHIWLKIKLHICPDVTISSCFQWIICSQSLWYGQTGSLVPKKLQAVMLHTPSHTR